MQPILEEPGISAAPTHQPVAELVPSEEAGAAGGASEVGGPSFSLLPAQDTPLPKPLSYQVLSIYC